GIGAELGAFRPGARADELIDVPLLFQIADLDRSAPPHAAETVARAARAEVRHYPGDHFDLFAGRACHVLAVEHALHFLARHASQLFGPPRRPVNRAPSTRLDDLSHIYRQSS